MDKQIGLVFDIGSSSIKAGLFFFNNSRPPIILRRCYADFLSSSSRGWWIDAWEAAFFSIVNEFILIDGDAFSALDSVIICGNCPSLVVVDDEGLALIDVLRWSELDCSFRGENSYYLALFKAASASVELSLVSQFLSPAEYFSYKLSGVAASFSPRSALDKFFWDRRDDDVKPFLSYLPPFVRWGEPMGEVVASEWNSFKVKAGVKLYAGAPDYAFALLGVGAIAGVVCDRTGTSEGINFVFRQKDVENCNPLCLELMGLGAVAIPHPVEELVNLSFVFSKSFDLSELQERADLWKSWGDISRRGGFKWVVCGGLARSLDLNQKKSALLGLEVETMKIHEAELLGGEILMQNKFKKTLDKC